jgi:hypothetical protein
MKSVTTNSFLPDLALRDFARAKTPRTLSKESGFLGALCAFARDIPTWLRLCRTGMNTRQETRKRQKF